MIIGIGVDVVRISRIEEALRRHGERFERRLFTPEELAYCQGMPRPALHLAGRFAAKEAASKALGTGMKGVSFREIEIRRQESGRPWLLFHGRAARVAEALGVKRAHVSLSHERDLAVAMVVLEGEDVSP
ncbi:holo-ACP synthase [Thermosulfuriphilus sp.]